MAKIGILHPGEMGISVAVSALRTGHEVYWASHQRSDKTRQRAEQHGVADVHSLAVLCQHCEIILCVCPPHAAEDVANAVIENGFKGYYLDANAISPQRSIKIGQRLNSNQIHFIDGGIIGGPAWKPQETRLYLSGPDAKIIADCFSHGLLDTKILGTEIGKASALKMCYAAYSKGTTALLATILATAESLGVRNDLNEQWDSDEPGFSEQVDRRLRRVTVKAWRFEGEMHEIADTFREVGLPGGFHESAAEIYQRMATFKDAADTPELDDVLEALLNQQQRP